MQNTISTLYNYDNKIKTTFKRVINQGMISRILILLLIIWNITLTITIYKPMQQAPFPTFTDSENELIMQLEEIPTEKLN